MIDAKELRNKETLSTLPPKAGYYKWWANKETARILFDKLDVDYNNVQDSLETRDELLCIYIGIAAKESIKQRLNWHINDVHGESQVRNGTLSTLRQSISSIISGDQRDKEGTNAFIDKLFVEWFSIDAPIKSEEAKNELHAIERKAMQEHLYILNIQDNTHPLSKTIKTKLKQLRKQSKIQSF